MLKLATLYRRTQLRRAISVLLVAALLLPTWPTQPKMASAQTETLHPALREIAAENSDQLVRVIVQLHATVDASRVGSQWNGGTVYHRLSMLNALALEIPAGRLLRLAADPVVRRISPDAVVLQTGETDSEVVAQEEFNGNAEDMARAVNWRWQELGESDGFDTGNVALVSFLAGTMEGLRVQGAHRGAQASVRLDAGGDVSLSIGYRRKGFNASTDVITLDLSMDQGATWQQIALFQGPATDPVLNVESFDLAALASDQIMLRIMSGNQMADDAGIYIDFIRIEVNPNTALPHRLHLPLVMEESAAAVGIEAQSSNAYVLDRFDSVSYANNHGSANWTGSWVENDPFGTPGANGESYVGIVNGRLVINQADKYTERIEREINLAGAQSAILSFDWQTVGLDTGETLALLVRNNTLGYQTLVEFGGNQQGQFSQNISQFIDSSVKIRFANRSSDWEGGEKVYIDNVKIEWQSAPPPPLPPVIVPGTIDTSNLASTYVKAIGADQVWNRQQPIRGGSVSVAVVDSGVAPHLDLTDINGNSRILVHAGFVDGTIYEYQSSAFADSMLTVLDTNGSIEDFYGHGTHVAGTIAGDGKRSNGAYMGVAPEAKLIDMKVINDYGVGNTSDVVAGLQWIHEHAALYNIRVVNMSLNSTVVESYLDNPLSTAAEILWFNGITVVVSVGNNGDNDDSDVIYPPANDPFVISVGATEDQGTVDINDDPIAPYSVHGMTIDGFLKPEIVVPGTDIVAPLSSSDANLAIDHPTHVLDGEQGKYYFRMSGTSMAAAVVAGAVALLLDANPALTPDQVKYRLMDTGLPFGDPLGQATTARVSDGLVALYLFNEGSGNIVYDVSGMGTPYNLTIQNPANVTWQSGSLAINNSTILSGANAPAKLYTACQSSHELTIEAWVTPQSEIQEGPARIVTLSADPYQRNFTLAQEWDQYIARLRISITGDMNGMPELSSGIDQLISSNLMQHVVFTHHNTGDEFFYIDGVAVEEMYRGGHFSNWDGNFKLALANEFTMDRPWLGNMHLVAVYCRALTPDEVAHNYSLGEDAAPQRSSYLNVLRAIHGTGTESANQGLMPNMLLAKMAMIAYWASQDGSEITDWSNIDWNSVNWNSVNWNSVNWNSVNWNSVNWNSVNWNSVNWNSVNWNSVNWNSVNWNSVNWNSVNWNSVNWNSVNWNSVDWN